ncbi:MAG TPA: ferrous iron transport protein B [Clostridiales bacterium]|nr:ferrous iron transport protein B [Clostridiales bacterium]
MGLTSQSTGAGVLTGKLNIKVSQPTDKIVALAGNPNVGKSTVFNSLTGLKQHTGNWPGKTVTNAQGRCRYKDCDFILVDVPGTYSLSANSAEEEVARDFICFGNHDVVVVVADATCLERNLNLVLQILEINQNVVVCLNLIDEAERKQIHIDTKKLSRLLGVPVIPTSARSGKGIKNLIDAVYRVANQRIKPSSLKITYDPVIEQAVALIENRLSKILCGSPFTRWIALKLLECDNKVFDLVKDNLGVNLYEDKQLLLNLDKAISVLAQNDIHPDEVKDIIVSNLISSCEDIYNQTVTVNAKNYNKLDRKIDAVLTSRVFGIPVMLILLGLIFWITIEGANIPSALLSDFLFWIEAKLSEFFMWLNSPVWLHDVLVLGVYRTLAWVVSVMLPPMAIFFPLFTLLEDLGYLPRVAFNLDNYFKKCNACGKQALTMCMGFGCNAAGVIGCRIINSPRERLIAVLTNNFMPCNGRFPTLIALISMFFAVFPLRSVVSTLLLLGIILLGMVLTFATSKLLSKTILKGVPSSFTLELPPYRKPQVGKIIIRSIFDRTIFVLGRAVSVAAPAGLVIWLLANIHVNDISLLAYCAAFLDPFARLIGMDGYILLAFILGFPANELVIPIIIMSYAAEGSMIELSSLAELKNLLVSNGWTWLTALCVMIFTLMHWPCGTTCLTIKKETGSIKWTALAVIIPTAIGLLLCFILATAARLLGLA